MSNSKAVEMEMQGQAERWLVRLQKPDCTDEERAACRRWQAQSPAHQAAFREAANIWRWSAEVGEVPAIAHALREAERNKTTRGMHAPPWLPRLALASAIGLMVVMGAMVWITPDANEVRYETVLGEQRTVDLSDGTAVVLDTHTALVARYSGRQRLIELENGQAQFQVKSDPKRPFIVKVAGSTVTAVGTQFQVRVDDTAATVTLLEGSVVVKAPLGGALRYPATTLSPGQQLHFNRAGSEWTTANVELNTASAWTEGQLFATEWRLDDLVSEMNRYSSTKLRVADPALAELRISGGFRAGDPQGLALVLEHSVAVRASQVGGEIVLSRKSTE